MPTLTSKLQREKPWAILGLTRAAYEAARPWARMKSRKTFEDLLRKIHEQDPGLVREMIEHGQAELLAKAIFGEEAGEEAE
jgi:hypothetical protein